MPYFPARLDFPSPSLSAPGSPRMMKALKEHDSTLFQCNGLILKQGDEFAHGFNVEQIKCVEAKVQKATRDTETLEESKDSFVAFSRAYIETASAREEENTRKPSKIECKKQEKV